MKARAIAFTVLALGAGAAGFVLIWSPWLGCALSYGAPLLAGIGLACGIGARRRAKRDGSETWTGTATTITNFVVLPVVALFALSCGTLNAVGSVALSTVSVAAAVAPGAAALAIDERVPPGQFWGSDRLGGYFGAFPNPVGIGLGEQEGEVRAAVRRTVVSVGFLLAAYVYVFGDDEAPPEPGPVGP